MTRTACQFSTIVIAVEMDGQGMIMEVLFDCLVLCRNPSQMHT